MFLSTSEATLDSRSLILFSTSKIFFSRDKITFSCSDFNSINFSFACKILSFLIASASVFASFKIEAASVLVLLSILFPFDFSIDLKIIKPTAIPIKTPTIMGSIIPSII